MAQLKLTQINDTGFLHFPAGTSAQRPSSPQEGMIRYNTDLNQTEYYDGLAWRNIKDFGLKATGGDAVSNIVVGGIPYTVHYFMSTGNSTFTVTKGGEVEYLIVAGGGGAGGRRGGGGGAGGLITGSISLSPGIYDIIVGSGGGGANRPDASSGVVPQNGENSSAFELTAIGGGHGGSMSGGGDIEIAASSGGSGGGGAGASGPRTPGAGTTNQGNSGGNGNTGTSNNQQRGGGGGGAGGPGENATDNPNNVASNGGIGIASSITGPNLFYAGGGGAGIGNTSGTLSQGGLGGGGNGGRNNIFASDGEPGTGGGGGAQGASCSSGDADTSVCGGIGRNGGSGVVIVRYRIG